MGEETKPKVEGGRRFPPRKGGSAAKSSGPKKSTYLAPTPELQQFVFRVGGAQDAAKFHIVKKTLAKYVGGKTGGRFARYAIANLEEPPDLDEPADPPSEPGKEATAEAKIAYKKAYKKWDAEYDQHMKDIAAWREAKAASFQLVLQHCDPEVEERITSSDEWSKLDLKQDLVGLLKLIQGICHKHDDAKQGAMAYVEQDLDLKLHFQRGDESLQDFYRAFKARAEIVDTFGGRAGFHPKLYQKHAELLAKDLGVAKTDLTAIQQTAAKKASCDEYLAALFIRISNEKTYGPLKKALDNKSLFNEDAYPLTMEEAYRYLQNYQPEGGSDRGSGSSTTGNRTTGNRTTDHGMAFFEGTDEVCHGCGETGHILYRCPKLTGPEKRRIYRSLREKETTGQNHTEVGTTDSKTIPIAVATPAGEAPKEEGQITGVANISVSLSDASIGSLDENETDYFDGVGFFQPSTDGGVRFDCGRNRLFLDSCATQHCMFAPEYLANIHDAGTVLRQNCNAGYKLSHQVGNWNGYEFWINSDGIANLFSIPTLEDSGHVIKYVTGGKWEVYTPNGKIITFTKAAGVCNGMPFIDLDAAPHTYVRSVSHTSGFVGIQTIRQNMEGFTAEQVSRAKTAREALAMMAHPSADRIKRLVSSSNVLTNAPFNAMDLNNADLIFGPDRGAIRGKSVRHAPTPVHPSFTPIPGHLFERLRDVVLTADVMFCNGLPFLVTLSRGIKMLTAEYLPSRSTTHLSNKLSKVLKLYRRGGFLVKLILMDMEFAKLQDHLDDVQINTTAAREHVGDVERAIRTIKERCRSTASQLPYRDSLPDAIVIHLVYFAVFWLNSFPSESGVSQVYSPREILTGLKADFLAHCKAPFGAYVEAHADPDVPNTNAPRTSPCIVLGPTGNIQGSVKCFDLETKRVIIRRTVRALPMPDRVIRRVRKLGMRATHDRSATTRLEFLDRSRRQYAWDNTDLDDDYSDPLDLDDMSPAEFPGVSFEDNDSPTNPSTTHATDASLASAACSNANLTSTVPTREIAGVDLDINVDENNDDDTNDNDNNDDDASVQFVATDHPQFDTIHLDDDDDNIDDMNAIEADDAIEDEVIEDDVDPTIILPRRSERLRHLTAEPQTDVAPLRRSQRTRRQIHFNTLDMLR